MTQQITLNGRTYSDDGGVGHGMADGEFRENFIPMCADLMVEMSETIASASAEVDEATNQAQIATNQANIAIGAAASTVTGPGSTGTSITSLMVGLGVKNFTIQPGKTLYLGMPIVIASTASPDDAMYGPLLSYNSSTGATSVNVTALHMATPGTFITAASWTVSLTGAAAVWSLINELKGAPIASAATINLDAATGNYLHITGSTGPVTAVTLAQGAEREVTLDGAPTFVHSSSLILPGGANVTGAAGDVVTFRGEGGGVTRVTSWVRGSGKAMLSSGFCNMVVLTSTQTWTPPSPDIVLAEITVIDGGYGGGTTTNSSPNPSPGANAGVSVVSVAYGVTYTATIGAGGPGNAAGTALPGQAGGTSSFSGAGLTTVTTAIAQLKRPGGPGILPGGGSPSAYSGDSMLSPVTAVGVTPTGLGASAPPAATGAASIAGRPGAVIIRF